MNSVTKKLNRNKVGLEVKRLREEKLLTQEELAKALKWQKQVVSDIETGKAQSLEKLMLLSDFFDISMDSFKKVGFQK